MTLDRDLQSIQEVRDLVAAAKSAQAILATFSQKQIDDICCHIAAECARHAEELAKMANEETGFGIWQDKILKNQLGSTMTWNYIKDMKTVGIISENKADGILEIGVPMGVVAALIPSTNPTSTVMYKSIISIKAGNSIVISPHPGAKNCIIETAKIIQQAAEEAGAPEGTVNYISLTTMEATNTLLKHRDVGVILATGGEAMVRAAYSSGNPAIGVGPGNGPSYIERTADIKKAVKRIFDSKTFDNGTICASEQSIVTECCIENEVVAVGETGLDFHYDLSPRLAQEESFRRHIDMAVRVGKPLIVHVREAYGEALEILREERADRCGGVIHCFSGDWQDAEV